MLLSRVDDWWISSLPEFSQVVISQNGSQNRSKVAEADEGVVEHYGLILIEAEDVGQVQRQYRCSFNNLPQMKRLDQVTIFLSDFSSIIPLIQLQLIDCKWRIHS